jgi:hypothetical protein
VPFCAVRSRLLWTVLVIVIVLWLLGFLLNVVGGVIHCCSASRRAA